MQFSRNKLHAIHTPSSHTRAPLTQFLSLFFVLKQVQFDATLSKDNGGCGIGGQNIHKLFQHTILMAKVEIVATWTYGKSHLN